MREAWGGRPGAGRRRLQRVRAALLAAVLLVAAAGGSATAPAGATRVVDDRRTAVELAQPPQRIVSLLPALTEMVCALGACARLVGVDRYSNHPPAVRSLPQMGGGIDPSIEAVLALKPDLVLLATSARGAERLRALGLKVVALEPRSVADVQRVLGLLGTLLGVPDAGRVWREIDSAVAAALATLPGHARQASVYFEVNRGPYAAGPASFTGELMQRLGVRNIIRPGLGPYPKINPEAVVRADPDVIMLGERNLEQLDQRPGWRAIRAVRERRICVFAPEQADVLVRAGPRMPEAARLLVDCLARKAP